MNLSVGIIGYARKRILLGTQGRSTMFTAKNNLELKDTDSHICPSGHCLASLGEPNDTKQCPWGQIFLSLPNIYNHEILIFLCLVLLSRLLMKLWVSWSAPSINVGWKLRNYFVMFHQKIFLFSQIPQILLVLLLVETKGLWKLLLGLHLDMSRDTTRAVFGPGLTESGLYSHRSLLVAWNFSIRKKRNFTIYVANTKAQLPLPRSWYASLLYAYVVKQHIFSWRGFSFFRILN